MVPVAGSQAVSRSGRLVLPCDSAPRRAAMHSLLAVLLFVVVLVATASAKRSG